MRGYYQRSKLGAEGKAILGLPELHFHARTRSPHPIHELAFPAFNVEAGSPSRQVGNLLYLLLVRLLALLSDCQLVRKKERNSNPRNHQGCVQIMGPAKILPCVLPYPW
jgi:hypothetical protein